MNEKEILHLFEKQIEVITKLQSVQQGLLNRVKDLEDRILLNQISSKN